MKNKLLKITLRVILIVEITVHYSSAQIPNNDFENWTVQVMVGDKPDYWFTSNGDLLPYNVFKDSLDTYSGNYSAMLTNIVGAQGGLFCYFPLTYHPFQLKGYYKSDFTTTDTALIKIYLFNNNLMVDSGETWITTSSNNWTNFTTTISTISVNADSANIFIQACRHQQNKFHIDMLSLEEPGAAQTFSTHSIQLFPNPASDKIFISGTENISVIKIFDLNGRIVSEIKNTTGVTAGINISNLPSGIYFLEVVSDGKVSRNYFVKD